MTADSLIWAAKRGDLVALETAIRSGANVNSEDSQGWTALFHAAHHGNTKALQLLIDAGADVNRGRESGFTALFSAVGGGHVEAVRLLLDAGAEIAPVQGVELRGYCIQGNSERHKAILTMLDEEERKYRSRLLGWCCE
jgi:ankyrin repeat protein